jgi:hypothetical protein
LTHGGKHPIPKFQMVSMVSVVSDDFANQKQLFSLGLTIVTNIIMTKQKINSLYSILIVLDQLKICINSLRNLILSIFINNNN